MWPAGLSTASLPWENINCVYLLLSWILEWSLVKQSEPKLQKDFIVNDCSANGIRTTKRPHLTLSRLMQLITTKELCSIRVSYPFLCAHRLSAKGTASEAPFVHRDSYGEHNEEQKGWHCRRRLFVWLDDCVRFVFAKMYINLRSGEIFCRCTVARCFVVHLYNILKWIKRYGAIYFKTTMQELWGKKSQYAVARALPSAMRW